MTRTRAGDPAPYRDPACTVDERVEDLLGRMTLSEKVAQLGSAWVFQLVDGTDLCAERAPKLLEHGLGHVTRVSGASSLGARDAARVANAIQRFLVEETRLGIPAIIHEEICSGLTARQSTVFPQAIGVASSWDPDLAEAIADALRLQMRAIGAHQGLSPVLDVCRDPRWGRLEETFGEDPYLVARMGAAFVRGLQSDDLSGGVIATAKHFVGYAASEGGMNWAPGHIPARELREVYLQPFEAVVRAAGLRSVMNGYQELDGVPCAADRGLLTGILRDEWGFDGCVVSDYFSVRQLAEYHRLVADASQAAVVAMTAGIDVELPGTDCYGEPLLAALASGDIDEKVVDVSVRRVLRTKFELGIFERPFADLDAVAAVTDTPQQRALARRVAHKSMVLLRNDGILPLRSHPGSVAVIGPNADAARHLFGDYTFPAHAESLREMRTEDNVFSIPIPDGAEFGDGMVGAPSVLESLRERLGPAVRYARGCDVNSGSTEGFAAAVALAAESDVAVMVMGDKSGLTNDCTSGEGRDRASLDLPGVQEDLVRAVVATGTPVVLVLVVGRPAGSVWIHEHCAAVLLAWLPGQEGAGAITDVLVGEISPGGKLPISFPRTVGQVPTYYAHKISGGRSHWNGDYVDSPSSPLYPFGYGIGYATFALSEVAVEQDEVTWSDTITVRARVTNTGDRSGDEVVQLYVRDPEAAVTRPVLELKGFARIGLEPGESKVVTFQLPVGQVGFYDREMQYVVEPGVVEVFVGTSARDLVPAGTFTVAPDPAGLPVVKVFDGSVSIT
ncbi:MAG: beta-glucosidase [Actinobacteria bacterium RBG_16_70_17]|nr:MAG: beta-glucosidase [Actinobacteria bacterium RBG_16_70_17]